MGLVFNDLGQETKGISTKRLRYGRINTLYSNQASDDFQHSFQTQKPREEGKKKDEQSFNTCLTFFFLLQQQYGGNKRTLFSPLHLKPLLKISIYNCIISGKVSLPRASSMCQNASLLPNARASPKPMRTQKQNPW